MMRVPRPAALAAAAALLAAGLSGCGALAPEPDFCGPAPLTASPATVAPGGTVTVSSPAADCDLGYGSDRTYTLSLSSEGPASDGSRVRVESGAFPVGADGAFAREVVVPAEMPAGPGSILVRGSTLDDCDDGEASCAAYLVSITVIG